jgi:hypothetical protein
VIKIDKANYDLYKKVYEVFWKHYSQMVQTEATTQGINIDTEKQSMPLALKGLKAGIANMFLMLQHAPKEFKTALDSDLKAIKLPGYFKLYAEVKDLLPKVLKRESLSSVDEYYFVMEILNDTTSAITDEEREILNACVINFELKRGGKR